MRRLNQAVVERPKGNRRTTMLLLHSSPYGRTVYEKLGFAPTNEMGLDLR